MNRKQNSLVPIAEALSGLGGPVKAIRDDSPQAVHHYTVSDQVNALVGASEADPDLGFMARWDGRKEPFGLASPAYPPFSPS